MALHMLFLSRIRADRSSKISARTFWVSFKAVSYAESILPLERRIFDPCRPARPPQCNCPKPYELLNCKGNSISAKLPPPQPPLILQLSSQALYLGSHVTPPPVPSYFPDGTQEIKCEPEPKTTHCQLLIRNQWQPLITMKHYKTIPYYPVIHKLKKTVSLTKSRWAGGGSRTIKFCTEILRLDFSSHLKAFWFILVCVTLPPFLSILTSSMFERIRPVFDQESFYVSFKNLHGVFPNRFPCSVQLVTSNLYPFT